MVCLLMKCSKAPGKVLLFGEHFVVKGKPALGVAVSLYVKTCVELGKGRVYSKQLGLIEPSSPHRALFDAVIQAVVERYGATPSLDVEVDSELPIASGMGSSAAIAVSLTHAVLSLMNIDFNREDVRLIAHEAEKAVHYRPSGVDTTLSTYGGFLYYKQGDFKRLDLRLPVDTLLVIVNTGQKRQTGVVVREVLERYSRIGEVAELIYSAGELVVSKAIKALEQGDANQLGELMLVNHGLLWSMGASSIICDTVVHDLLSSGAYGAKISGAGRGGVVIGLIPRSALESLRVWLQRKGYEFYIVEPDYTGVVSA